MIFRIGLFISAVLMCPPWLTAADMPVDDALRGLSARDESISSYRLAVQRGHIVSEVDPNIALTGFAGIGLSQNARDVFSQVSDRIRNGRAIAWQIFSTVERGSLFKTVL